MSEAEKLDEGTQAALRGILGAVTPDEPPVKKEGMVKDWLTKQVQTALQDAGIDDPEVADRIEDTVFQAALNGKLGDGQPSSFTASAINDMVTQLASAEVPEKEKAVEPPPEPELDGDEELFDLKVLEPEDEEPEDEEPEDEEPEDKKKAKKGKGKKGSEEEKPEEESVFTLASKRGTGWCVGDPCGECRETRDKTKATRFTTKQLDSVRRRLRYPLEDVYNITEVTEEEPLRPPPSRIPVEKDVIVSLRAILGEEEAKPRSPAQIPDEPVRSPGPEPSQKKPARELGDPDEMIPETELNEFQQDALTRFADHIGGNWKTVLSACWKEGNYDSLGEGELDDNTREALDQIRELMQGETRGLKAESIDEKKRKKHKRPVAKPKDDEDEPPRRRSMDNELPLRRRHVDDEPTPRRGFRASDDDIEYPTLGMRLRSKGRGRGLARGRGRGPIGVPARGRPSLRDIYHKKVGETSLPSRIRFRDEEGKVVEGTVDYVHERGVDVVDDNGYLYTVRQEDIIRSAPSDTGLIDRALEIGVDELLDEMCGERESTRR